MTISSCTSYGLQEIYTSAIQELKVRKEKGGLSESDFELITNCSSLDDVLEQFQTLAQQHEEGKAKQKIWKIGESLVNQLERFGVAIDMLAQSMPEVAGVNPIGIIWGSFRFLLIIARDMSNAVKDMLSLCDQLVACLPRVEIYVNLFASSDIQLLKTPLTHLYAEIVRFGLLAIKYFNRSLSRNVWHAVWTSTNDEIQDCIKQIERTSKEVDTAAQVEHMHHTNEEFKSQRQEHDEAERFRQDARLFFAHVQNVPTRPNPPTQQGININDTPQYLLSQTFTGRSDEISQIRTILSSTSTSPTICAIYGMSGLGKTQLALKYATLSYEQHNSSCIFWLHASTTQKLHQNFTNILNLIDHPDRYHPDSSARLTMTRLWLEKFGLTAGGDERWLLVVDDASTSTIPFLRENLPRTNPHGSILLTTQSEGVAKALADKPDHILQLSVPSAEDAAAMFLEQARKEATGTMDEQKDEIEDLVKSVGCLPLAVSHAAGFMSSSRMKLSDILALYRSEQKMELLTWDNKLSTYEEKSVAATFKRKFDYLNEQYPAAGDLLKLLSFFDPEKIQIDMLVTGAKMWEAEQHAPKQEPKALLEEAKKPEKSGFRKRFKTVFRSARPDPASEQQNNKIEQEPAPQPNPLLSSLTTSILSPPALHSALSHLQDTSLITPLHTSTTLSIQMHDLIRFMIQKTDIPSHSKTALLTYAVSITCHVFRSIPDRTSPQSWPECSAIIPHIMALKALARAESNIPQVLDNLIWANTEAAEYLRSRGLYSEAESCYTDNYFTPSIPSTTIISGLADTLTKQGRYKEAESICLNGLNTSSISSIDVTKLSASQLPIAAELINTSDKQSHYNLAITLGTPLLSELTTRKDFGPNNPVTLNTAHNLALAHGHTSSFTTASSLFKTCINSYTSHPSFGPSHPHTLRSINALANLHDRMNQHESASKLYIQALTGRETLFGPSHPQTLKTVCGLANLWMRKGLLEEAYLLYSRALSSNPIDTRKNPDTLRAQHGIAAVLLNQGHIEAAVEKYKIAVAGRIEVLGEEHADTLRSMEGLGIAYSFLGRVTEARRMCERVWEGRRRVLGVGNEETVQVGRQVQVLREMEREMGGGEEVQGQNN